MKGEKPTPRIIRNVRELLKKHDVVIAEKYVAFHYTIIILPVIDNMVF